MTGSGVIEFQCAKCLRWVKAERYGSGCPHADAIPTPHGRLLHWRTLHAPADVDASAGVRYELWPAPSGLAEPPK